MPMEIAQQRVRTFFKISYTWLKMQYHQNCMFQGLAKIAAAMANGGSLKGVKVLGEKGWKALHAHPTPGNLGMNLPEDIFFTQAFRFSISTHFSSSGGCG